jgi:hypothetical protein
LLGQLAFAPMILISPLVLLTQEWIKAVLPPCALAYVALTSDSKITANVTSDFGERNF